MHMKIERMLRRMITGNPMGHSEEVEAALAQWEKYFVDNNFPNVVSQFDELTRYSRESFVTPPSMAPSRNPS